MANTRIQLRRGKAAFWTDANPILFPGEPGLETDTRKLKFGDGRTPWRELEYALPGTYELPPEEPTDPTSLAEHINDLTPHPVYDDGASLSLIYQNATV